MRATTQIPAEPPNLISALAELIREAVIFLMKQRRYSLDQLCFISGGGDRRGHLNGKSGRDAQGHAIAAMPHPDVVRDALHKNSILKVSEMRRAPTVSIGQKRGRMIWKEIKDAGARRDSYVLQWLWSPQIETLEKLELLLEEAIREGFRPQQMVIRVTAEDAGLPELPPVVVEEPKPRPPRPPRKKAPIAETPPATPAPTPAPAPVAKVKAKPKAKKKASTKSKPRGRKKPVRQAA